MEKSYKHIQQTGIFALPLSTYKLNRKFTKKELDFVEKTKNKTVRNCFNDGSSDTYILENKALSGLKSFAQDCLNHYLLNIYNPLHPVEIYVTQSWLNYTRKGESHHSHKHNNSIVSGVLYIKTDKEDQIIFENDNYELIDIMPKQYNSYNSTTWFFNVNEYECVLFPSKLRHQTNLKHNDSTRISLAFNSFIKGVIGTTERLTEIKI